MPVLNCRQVEHEREVFSVRLRHDQCARAALLLALQQTRVRESAACQTVSDRDAEIATLRHASATLQRELDDVTPAHPASSRI
jgi:hypothetical protein